MLRKLRWSVLTVAVAVLVGAGTATGQPAARHAVFSHPELRESEVLARGGYVVVVDLDENELHVLHGRTVLWSAPVGTGMGLRLETTDQRWSFDTPTGVYQVQAKEENPTWYAPDWYFIENRLSVPPRNDPRRRFPGGLGAAAVYIGRGLAIHGTDKPDLLGQRVSHGCIRLANEYAQRLYHNVQIGTKVIIVGRPEEEMGELIPGRVPGTGPVDARTQRMRERAKADRERLQRELGRASHDDLADRLRDALRDEEEGNGAGWPAIASELVRRVMKENDVVAARVLFEIGSEPLPRRVRAEFATFMADVAARRGELATRALAALPARDRGRAARVIASAVMDLFGGDPGDPVLPWPTRRIVAGMVDDDSRPGLEALSDAERAVRGQRSASPGGR